MGFPAANGPAFPLTLDVAWAAARNAAAQIQAQCGTISGQIATGSVSSQSLLNSTGILASLNLQLTQYAAVPGLAAYAQAQVNNPSLDVAGAFNAMQTALVAVVTWVVTNFPKDSNGNLLYTTFNGSGQVVWVSFTSAQLAGLSALVTTLSNTIT